MPMYVRSPAASFEAQTALAVQSRCHLKARGALVPTRSTHHRRMPLVLVLAAVAAAGAWTATAFLPAHPSSAARAGTACT
eukprot:2095236-Alexandrium_andersonii.AAC.1